jgi:hypothetical protein
VLDLGAETAAASAGATSATSAAGATGATGARGAAAVDRAAAHAGNGLDSDAQGKETPAWLPPEDRVVWRWHRIEDRIVEDLP